MVEPHRLTEIDVSERTATCSVCGPTKIRSKGNGRWLCRVVANRNKHYAGERENKRRSDRLRKKPYLKFRKDHCERCGFMPEAECQLDVHHRNGDHSDNRKRNLLTMCANCHRLVHHDLRQ